MKKNKVTIIGLGNDFLGDEGAGIHALRLLKKKLKKSEADIIEAGTIGLNLIHHIEDGKKIIFIDAGFCGMKPGEYRRFRPEEAVSQKISPGYSLHDFDLIGFIDYIKKIKHPEKLDIVIYCIQPAEIKVSQRLSFAVSKNLPSLVNHVIDDVDKNSRQDQLLSGA